MRFAATLLFSSLLSLTTSTPVVSPLDAGSLPSTIRNYITSAAIAEAALKRIDPICTNLQNISMDPGALPPPSPGLKLWHIAVGRGTQNYSCPTEKGDAAPPTVLGAVARLYNVTCAAGYSGSDKINSFTDAIALQDRNAHLAMSILQSGNHFFPDVGATTPVFNLNMGNPSTDYGIVFSSKKANITAPEGAGKGQDGSAAVPWLKLASLDPLPAQYTVQRNDAVPGIREVYRLNTAGGAAPKTCQGLVGKSFQKEYAAEYWFWH